MQYIIDINMGCPVKKVVKTGAGCALMKNIKLAQQIASVVVETSNVLVTVKIRKGWDGNDVNAVDFEVVLFKFCFKIKKIVLCC